MINQIKIYDIDVEGLSIEELNSFSNKPFTFELDLYLELDNSGKLYNFRGSIANREGLKLLFKEDRDYAENKFLVFQNYHLIVIDDFSFKKLEEIIRNICNEIDIKGKDWRAIAKELSDYFWFEYHYML